MHFKNNRSKNLKHKDFAFLYFSHVSSNKKQMTGPSIAQK